MRAITTHVLDTARGCPAAGLPITLARQTPQGWQDIASGHTNADGRVIGLLPDGQPLPAGRWRMHFDTATYFKALGENAFYPWADVVFQTQAPEAHFHIPLLLSPFGYTTYRGS